ncbi:MAG TPA: hypothetical protein VGF30_03860, partial [Bacteroidia bacterium]
MKKYITSIVMLVLTVKLSATTFYQQLCEFNFNWKKYAKQAPAGEGRLFNSDKEYIQAHLACVLEVLKSNPTAKFNAEQLSNRLALIEVLDGYRKAGKFPINYYRNERIPVFIDEHFTHCAVGYLLQQTGYETMALRIAATDNYAWLKDINDAEFPSWQEKSGFTMEELKLIQGAYDSYLPNALYHANKYEIPQKPAVMAHYFGNASAKKAENIWCKGEGTGGVLNGKWTQNYAVGMPWIVGYYENGQRSGQWQEYYQGTKQLCRTERWRNDKLNGLRKRYSMEGKLIEEILFKDGKAVTKTNYDLNDSLTWIRKPLDSNLVWTEVFTFDGAKIASGHETVYNPGNLLWFQNIELTALNSASISSRDYVASGNNNGNGIIESSVIPNMYNSPPLVEYKKEGEWMYYKEYAYHYAGKTSAGYMKVMLQHHYKHFGTALFQSVQIFENLKNNSAYDSIRVVYKNDNLQNFYGYASNDYIHLQVKYYDVPKFEISKQSSLYLQIFPRRRYSLYKMAPNVSAIGQYNKNKQKIG